MTGHKKHGLVGIGNAILDILAHATEDFLQDHGIEKEAMTLIDAVRADFIYGKMEPALQMSGGSAANSLAVFASLGGKGAFIGKVADDQFGDMFHHDINAAGVHFSTPRLTEGPATARCLILVTPDAERTMCTNLGACAELTAGDLDHGLITGAHITLLEGYLFDRDTAKHAFRTAAETARQSGGKVAFTLSDYRCVERHHTDFTDFIKGRVDILFGNEKEIKALYKTDDFDAAVAAVAKDCGLAVITRGSKGAVIVTPEGTLLVEPVKVKVVDTTGAGDSFSAAFLWGLSEGKPLHECGQIAAIVAAEIISQVGARPQQSLKDVIAEKMPAKSGSSAPPPSFKAA